tara:strand:- start:3882 stop:4646 length:765 start_codon:yes stop_codon:yes gene_type:complete
MSKIALITPVFNPTEEQIKNLIRSYASLKNTINCFYLAVNKNSENIKILKEKTRGFNCVINIEEDDGPDNALRRIVNHVSEEFVWMLTCGELIELKDDNFLRKVKKDNIVFGNTTFINQNGLHYCMDANKFNRFYKYKIPILNLSSCIMSKENFIKSSPIKKYKVATDYEQILRLYSLDISLIHTDSFKLYFFNDGNSVKNRITGFAEMYHISKYFYPRKNIQRILVYFLLILKHRINPIKFFKELSKIDDYII